MKKSLFGLMAAGATISLSIIWTLPAQADVRVRIDKSSQTMTVWVDGSYYSSWPVSTGRRGYSTPGGSFRPSRLEPRWYSRKYDNAPMHNAIFFHGGFAIHATNYVSTLGQAASHGCVRLHPSHARELYSLVKTYGARSTRITITN